MQRWRRSEAEAVSAESERAKAAGEIATLRVEMGDSVRDAIVRYLAIGNASGLLPAVHRIERRRGVGQWDQLAIGILRSRYISLLRELVRRTPLESELKLGVDRASFRLSRGSLSSIGKTVELIVGEGASVGGEVREARA